ncbi:hypothetical protein [Polaribacter glomeratus]|uniref:Uncharacterized protein n=1 Tax=Polaribacter glomeratus TaxID=102 RepID=A0A2S7WFQ6_9FLAO|nr:hypothetical protein [Polaribacter glomeratus]PQJ76458.1 hypothetical protein BTO16_11140 [Polaribacter glomeratus]TXD65592.1 hypothetical protein ESX12_10445 [Polaribacter glomeratus]
MRTNSFTAKMSKKSNVELEAIFEEKSKYTEEAVQAVIWELENRNLIDKKTTLYQDPDKIIEVVIPVSIEKETLEKHESPFEELVLPVLYSKKAIQGFTIFFTTIFGAVLLMQNLRKMNKPKEGTQVLVFGIVYTLFSIMLLNYLPKMFFITLIFNLIGYAVLSEFFWNKHLGKELGYNKKQIWKPLFISTLILFLIVFLQFLPQILEL